jgi:hypothetical protein
MMDFKVKATKFKTNLRGLDIIQAVYALLLALGLREVFLAFYTIFLQQRVSGSDNLVVALLLFANILLLSVRFFWVPRNFRRLYYVSEYCRILGNYSGLPAYEASTHILIILAHGALYFLLCKEFEYFVFVTSSYNSLMVSAFTTYVFLHVSLLTVNGFWIMLINKREDMIRQKSGQLPLLQHKSESKIWYRSNLAFSLLTVAPIVVLSSCQASFSECLSVAYSNIQRPYSLIPTSSYNIASLFELMAAMFSGFNKSRDFLLAMWALLLLGVNSIIDLFFTAGYYIYLEDVETEEVYEEKTP